MLKQNTDTRICRSAASSVSAVSTASVLPPPQPTHTYTTMHSTASAWAGPTTLATAAAFTGAALYVSCVEHPARLQLDDASALAQWKPSYRRASIMQVTLALTSAACGVKAAAGARGKDARWLVAAGAMFVNIPYTLAGIAHINKRLLQTPVGDGETTAKLRTWGKLHAVRAVLGLVATGAAACGLAEPV